MAGTPRLMAGVLAVTAGVEAIVGVADDRVSADGPTGWPLRRSIFARLRLGRRTWFDPAADPTGTAPRGIRPISAMNPSVGVPISLGAGIVRIASHLPDGGSRSLDEWLVDSCEGHDKQYSRVRIRLLPVIIGNSGMFTDAKSGRGDVVRTMSNDGSFFDRMFNRPSGVPGRIGAILMAHMNDTVPADVLDLVAIEPTDAVLEIGFGPGIGIEYAAEIVTEGYVAGVDVSDMMVERATRRNESAVESGLVDLRLGTVEELPFPDETFDAAFSINSLHAWPDQRAGLEEVHRVLQPGGTVAILLTKHAGRPDEPLDHLLRAAEFENVRHSNSIDGDCVLGKTSDPT